MPIQVAEDRFVQFRYAPDYLTGKYRHLRADGEIGPKLPWLKGCLRSEIVLDGGNVVGWGDRAILTDKVFAENPGWERRKLLAALERLLEVERIILIPQEPGDVTGHADGVVRFVDGGTVVVNDYRRVDGDYRRAVLQRLKDARLGVRELPYRPVSESSEGMPSAIGNYVNFLQVRGLIVLPIYGFPGDDDSRGVLARTFPGSSVATLDCPRARFGWRCLELCELVDQDHVLEFLNSMPLSLWWRFSPGGLLHPRPSAVWVPTRISSVVICPEAID